MITMIKTFLWQTCKSKNTLSRRYTNPFIQINKTVIFKIYYFLNLVLIVVPSLIIFLKEFASPPNNTNNYKSMYFVPLNGL